MAENNNPVIIEISKEFKVPVEKLYAAWNDGEQLKQWWHPFNKNLTDIKNDLKSGGIVQYDFDGEQKCHVRGEYKEVVENKKLVYTWNWDLEHDDMKNGDYTLTIEFEGVESGSRIKVKQEGFVEETATAPHKQGWERGLESLRSYLEGGDTDSSSGAGQQTDNRRYVDEDEIATRPGTDVQEQKDISDSGQSDTSQKETATTASGSADNVNQPMAEDPKSKGEGQPETTTAQASGGRGPQPVGPNQQTWENPEPGEEMKSKITEQQERLQKLHDNPNAQDPGLAELNKKQDIESRNEAPPHEKKTENFTQGDFDPAKHKTESPTH